MSPSRTHPVASSARASTIAANRLTMASSFAISRAGVAPRASAARTTRARASSPSIARPQASSSSSRSPSRRRRSSFPPLGARGGSVATRAAAAAVDLRNIIERLCDREDLTEEETEASLDALLDADPAQIAAFLVLLRAKGETPAEMAGMARAMKGRAVAVDAGDDVLDIVGTGGDDAGTVNISTGSCVLAAAAGAKVAKARPTSLRRSLSFSNETSTSSNN